MKAKCWSECDFVGPRAVKLLVNIQYVSTTPNNISLISKIDSFDVKGMVKF
jgi:hypothetical protein